MKEVKLIIESYKSLQAEGKKCVLATVIHVEGSSYRQPGARMLIDQDGVLTGAISGGCLEGDALKKALDVIKDNASTIITYDTLNEEDPTIGVALGCNGIIKILLEPIDFSNKYNAVELLKKSVRERKSNVIVTIYTESEQAISQSGTIFLINEDDERIGKLPDFLLAKIDENISSVMDAGRSSWEEINHQGTDYHVFFEYLQPSIKLVIVGAGNDVMPIIDITNILGWENKVIDCRVKYAMDNRTPPSCAILIDTPDDLLQEVDIDKNTVFALMTHNYNYDKAVLYTLLQQEDLRYIALLGPKKKLTKMLDDYQLEGKNINEEQLSKIYGPAGLNIGAETPEEIALSIIAEIKAVMSNKKGASLRYIDKRIHA